MAIVKGAFQMTGSIKGVSFYTVRGSDKVIMRTKGGASKEKIKSSPKFEGLRKQQKEWSGCAKFGSIARYAFGGLHRLADYNLTPVLNGIGKNLMKLDTESETGRRNLKLTAYPQSLEGFNFNRNYPFNTVLRVASVASLNREKLEASISVPRINTDIDLLNIQRLPFFRLIVAIGTVSDLYYNEQTTDYLPLVPALHGVSVTLTGEWHSTQTILPEQTMTVALEEAEINALADAVTVLVSMAVEFGNVGFTGQPQEVKYAGCGKVLVSR
jgi:hypothetical protein